MQVSVSRNVISQLLHLQQYIGVLVIRILKIEICFGFRFSDFQLQSTLSCSAYRSREKVGYYKPRRKVKSTRLSVRLVGCAIEGLQLHQSRRGICFPAPFCDGAASARSRRTSCLIGRSEQANCCADQDHARPSDAEQTYYQLPRGIMHDRIFDYQSQNPLLYKHSRD